MSRPHYYAYPPAPHPAAYNHLGMSLANTPVYQISRPMPQQPMRPVGRSRQPRQLRTPERKKRYGVIFDHDPLGGVAIDEDDDDSTWSMSRSRSSYWMQTQRRQPTMRARDSSPAQQIAARYRASHSSDGRPHTSSSTATYLQVPIQYGYSYATRSRTTSAETGMSSLSGPKLRYRDSRAHAMDRGTKEAYLMAVQNGAYYNIQCQRPGCRNMLPTIRDLAAHLAMHDLPPRRTNYASAPQYESFIDIGHSVDGRKHRRWIHSPTPYTRSRRSYRSKLRRYLAKLTSSCVPYYDDDDFF